MHKIVMMAVGEVVAALHQKPLNPAKKLNNYIE